VDEKFVDILSRHENKDKSLFMPRTPFVAAEFMPEGPAVRAGIQKEDQIIGLNGEPTPYFTDFYTKIRPLKNTEVSVAVLRNDTDTLNFTLTTTENGAIGIYPYAFTKFFATERLEYTLAQAIPAGIAKGWNFLGDQVKAFGQMFKGKIKASESLGGFASIGQMFGNVWQWERFWTMTAILSLILAFMNLLPIPALDGGHVMFLLYEVISGRKPSDKFMEYATMIGFILVISLVIYANGLDIIRSWFN
jgi:regulator of sigma E protease